MISWIDNSLGQARCAGSNVFPSDYMQDAGADPLPGMSRPITPVAPSTAAKPYKERSSMWWVAPLLIGGAAGLIFWRTIA